MTDPLPCPTCNEVLTLQRQEDNAQGRREYLWACVNGHWWRQGGAGWTPTEPDAVPMAGPVALEVLE